MKYLFMDTSGLMHAYNELNEMIKEEQIKLVVCSTVLEELDNHKDGDNSERKYKARKALALLNSNPESVIYVIDEVPNKFVLETLFMVSIWISQTIKFYMLVIALWNQLTAPKLSLLLMIMVL